MGSLKNCQKVCESYEIVNLPDFIIYKEFMAFIRVLKEFTYEKFQVFYRVLNVRCD